MSVLREIDDSTNLIALALIAFGVTLSLRQPGSGDTLIGGGLGAIAARIRAHGTRATDLNERNATPKEIKEKPE